MRAVWGLITVLDILVLKRYHLIRRDAVKIESEGLLGGLLWFVEASERFFRVLHSDCALWLRRAI